jgi:hypothetical protein
MITKKYTLIISLFVTLFFTEPMACVEAPKSEYPEIVKRGLEAALTALIIVKLIGTGAVIVPMLMLVSPLVNARKRVLESQQSPRAVSLEHLEQNFHTMCDSQMSEPERDQATQKMAEIQDKLSRI